MGEEHVGDGGRAPGEAQLAEAAAARAVQHAGGERAAEGEGGPVDARELRAEPAAEERAHPQPGRGRRPAPGGEAGGGEGPARDAGGEAGSRHGGGRRPAGERARQTPRGGTPLFPLFSPASTHFEPSLQN